MLYTVFSKTDLVTKPRNKFLESMLNFVILQLSEQGSVK